MGIAKLVVGNFAFDIYVPNRSIAESVPEGFAEIQRMAKAPQQKLAEQRRSDARASQPHAKPGVASLKAPTTADDIDPSETLLAALCLVMVADGRVSRSEKAQIQDVMEQAKTPWPQEDVLFRIDRFVNDVQRIGLKQKLNETKRAMRVFRTLGQETMVPPSLGFDGQGRWQGPRERAQDRPHSHR